MRTDRTYAAAVSTSAEHLTAGALHVWRADLDTAGQAVHELLDEQERIRAAHIVREHAQQRWIAARGVLRALLARYLDEDPRSLSFATLEHGKPVLDGRERSLHFNLSHSGALAVYALSEACPVGVDVESLERRERAKESRAPRERADREEMLRAWVRYEAEGKRVGVGVGNVRLRPPDAALDARASASESWIAELDLGRDALGAVALERAPSELLLRQWSI